MIRAGLLAFAVALVAARGADAARDLAERVKQVEKNAAQKFLALASTAETDEHGAISQKAFARVIDLDPENARARKALGWKRGAQGWTRDRKPAPAVPEVTPWSTVPTASAP